jgi:hypothetical protein
MVNKPEVTQFPMTIVKQRYRTSFWTEMCGSLPRIGVISAWAGTNSAIERELLHLKDADRPGGIVDLGAHLDVVAQMVDDGRRIHDGENGVLLFGNEGGSRAVLDARLGAVRAGRGKEAGSGARGRAFGIGKPAGPGDSYGLGVGRPGEENDSSE